MGEVYIVGAGPGDPDLLTFRALSLMQQADVVLYDRLVDPRIIDLVPARGRAHLCRQAAADHALPQEEISDLLVRLAREGKRVLRLKGGDPFMFGRGGEEIERSPNTASRSRSAPASPPRPRCAAYAGIPLTHRDHAQACVFVTGHGQRRPDRPRLGDADPAQPDRRDLHGARPIRGADAGVRRPRRRARTCPPRSSTTATRANQRVVVGTLATLAGKARAATCGPDDHHRRHGRRVAREVARRAIREQCMRLVGGETPSP